MTAFFSQLDDGGGLLHERARPRTHRRPRAGRPRDTHDSASRVALLPILPGRRDDEDYGWVSGTSEKFGGVAKRSIGRSRGVPGMLLVVLVKEN